MQLFISYEAFYSYAILDFPISIMYSALISVGISVFLTIRNYDKPLFLK